MQALLDTLARLGAVIRPDGDMIRFSGPLTPKVRAGLSQHKAELLDAMRRGALVGMADGAVCVTRRKLSDRPALAALIEQIAESLDWPEMMELFIAGGADSWAAFLDGAGEEQLAGAFDALDREGV